MYFDFLIEILWAKFCRRVSLFLVFVYLIDKNQWEHTLRTFDSILF